jgi:hypothetical protein
MIQRKNSNITASPLYGSFILYIFVEGEIVGTRGSSRDVGKVFFSGDVLGQ